MKGKWISYLPFAGIILAVILFVSSYARAKPSSYGNYSKPQKICSNLRGNKETKQFFIASREGPVDTSFSFSSTQPSAIKGFELKTLPERMVWQDSIPKKIQSMALRMNALVEEALEVFSHCESEQAAYYGNPSKLYKQQYALKVANEKFARCFKKYAQRAVAPLPHCSLEVKNNYYPLFANSGHGKRDNKNMTLQKGMQQALASFESKLITFKKKKSEA